jgi:hypothetical protein
VIGEEGMTAVCAPAQPGVRHWLVLAASVFVFSVLVHTVANQWWLNNNDGPDTYIESTHVALSLARGEGFRNPFLIQETGLTAHVAPAYPYLYAAVLRVFGTGVEGAWAVRLLTIGASALLWSLMPVFARVWGLPDRVGLISTAIGVMLPIPGSCFKWEAIFAALLLVCCACLAGVYLRHPDSTLAWPVAGLIWGVGFLLTPVLLSIWFGWLALTWFFAGRRAKWRIAFLILVPGAVITPWIVRNYEVFHSFILIRDNLGIELASSNADCVTAWAKRNARTGCLALTHPSINRELAQRFAQEGEIAFNKQQMKRGLTWIRENFARFSVLCAQRVRYFWFPPLDAEEGRFAVLNALIIGALTLLSLPGLVMLCSRNTVCGSFLVTGLMAYPAVYYFLQLDVRYRYPILWMTVIGVAWLISSLMERWAKLVGHANF